MRGLIVALGLLAWTDPALACAIGVQRSFENISTADEIIIGRVTGYELVDGHWPVGQITLATDDGERIVRHTGSQVAPSRIWYGPRDTIIAVDISEDGATVIDFICSYGPYAFHNTATMRAAVALAQTEPKWVADHSDVHHLLEDLDIPGEPQTAFAIALRDWHDCSQSGAANCPLPSP